MNKNNFKIITVFSIFILIFTIFNCGEPKTEKESDMLLPLLALTAGGGGKGVDERCFSDNECATGLFCGDAYNLYTPYTYNLCTVVPSISGTITGNGSGQNANLTSASPVADFSLTITAPGSYTFLASVGGIPSNTPKPEISVFPDSGKNAVFIKIRNASNNYQIRTFNFTNAGTYRVRVAGYYLSGLFGGGIRLFGSKTAVSGGGSCTHSASGSRCDDFAVNHLFNASYCTTSVSSGTYSANTCATQNGAKVYRGACTMGMGHGNTYGNGLITRNYYDASTDSQINSECSNNNGIRL
ncbi:hypothetical protein JWG41_09995 [Leptospira sp. 201903075]|nr:hypothetical protein [Leptospira chreensis]